METATPRHPINLAFLTACISRRSGGLLECIRGLGQELMQNREVAVEIMSLQDQFSAEDSALLLPLKVRLFKPSGPSRFGYSPGLLPALLNSQSDIIHLHGLWTYPSVATLRWTRRTQRPHLISPQGMLDTWALRNSWWKKKIAGWLYEGANLRNAACIHAVCRSEAEAFRDYGLKNPICIVPNGIDLPQKGYACLPTWADRIEPGRKVLLYLGRLHLKKNIHNLLRAWALLQQNNVQEIAQWALVIAGCDNGDGYEEEMKEIASGLNGNGKVCFVGPQFFEDNEACYYYSQAFILPSFSEGMPMVVLKAFAHAKPVLMTPKCNLPEGFNASAAICIEPSAESIASGLRQLFEMSDTDRHAMGLRGRKLVEERFTWPKVASHMWHVYEWVLGGGTPPPTVLTK